MNRDARFWVLLALFEVVFGLGIFAATRHYYLQRPAMADRDAPLSGVPAGHPPVAGIPAAPGGAMPVFPGDAMPVPRVDATPGDPDDIARRADEHFAAERYREAADLYEQLLKSGIRDVNLYNSLGISLQYLGQPAAALSVLEEGVEVDPGYQRIWLTLGFVHRQAGNTAKAREALAKAVQLGPDTDVGKSAAEMLAGLAEAPSG